MERTSGYPRHQETRHAAAVATRQPGSSMSAPFRARASVAVGRGLHPTPLFVTITGGKLVLRVGCRRPALAGGQVAGDEAGKIIGKGDLQAQIE